MKWTKVKRLHIRFEMLQWMIMKMTVSVRSWCVDNYEDAYIQR